MTRRRRLLFLLVAVLGLSNAGCLAVAAGCAGGAAGYAYYQGRVGRDFPAEPDPVWTAANTALADLNLPVVHTERTPVSLLESRNRDGEKVSLFLDTQPAKAPGDPTMTRVSVRVGVFGDHVLSNQILDRIAFHLVPAHTAEPPLADPPAQPAPAAPAVAPTGWRPTPGAPAPGSK